MYRLTPAESDVISEYMREKNIAQTDIAKALKINPSIVSRLIRGQVRFTKEKIAAVYDRLGHDDRLKFLEEYLDGTRPEWTSQRVSGSRALSGWGLVYREYLNSIYRIYESCPTSKRVEIITDLEALVEKYKLPEAREKVIEVDQPPASDSQGAPGQHQA